MSSQGWQYLPYLVVPMDTHGTTGMGYGIAMGQNFKHCTHTCTTCDPNTAGIPVQTLDIVEIQNLIFQVPIPPPVDQITQAHSCLIIAIWQDMSGMFMIEERGEIINYITTSPLLPLHTYEQLSDDRYLLHAWLSMAHSN